MAGPETRAAPTHPLSILVGTDKELIETDRNTVLGGYRLAEPSGVCAFADALSAILDEELAGRYDLVGNGGGTCLSRRPVRGR